MRLLASQENSIQGVLSIFYVSIHEDNTLILKQFHPLKLNKHILFWKNVYNLTMFGWLRRYWIFISYAIL
jgi:hypothetical protein